ncbi:C1q-related factor-like [Ptychodera flava]|uniref:C1q-related factor-like n=1 Tax=Ptychodera flava TaxID=63121 RepID=UPI00396A852B
MNLHRLSLPISGHDASLTTTRGPGEPGLLGHHGTPRSGWPGREHQGPPAPPAGPPAPPAGPPASPAIQANQKSAFSVVRTTSLQAADNMTIPFDKVLTNVGGNYDKVTSKFTCTIAGTYVFMFSLRKNVDGDPTSANLMLNGEIVVSVMDDDVVHNTGMVGNSAVVQLKIGDEVWLRLLARHSIFSDESGYCSLSGFLISITH